MNPIRKKVWIIYSVWARRLLSLWDRKNTEGAFWKDPREATEVAPITLLITWELEATSIERAEARITARKGLRRASQYPQPPVASRAGVWRLAQKGAPPPPHEIWE
jgi:hypothetical protein